MNFLVWRNGLRGPYAMLCFDDPRSSIDWKIMEPYAVVKLTGAERLYSLDEAMAAYLCEKVA